MNFDQTFKVMMGVVVTYIAVVSVAVLTVVGLVVFVTLKYFGIM